MSEWKIILVSLVVPVKPTLPMTLPGAPILPVKLCIVMRMNVSKAINVSLVLMDHTTLPVMTPRDLILNVLHIHVLTDLETSLLGNGPHVPVRLDMSLKVDIMDQVAGW
jgi:hypothetical protein